MINDGWRTVIISSRAELKYSDGNVIVLSDEKKEIPISQISVLMLNCDGIKLTTGVMRELLENNIKVIFCDKKYNPCGETCGYNNTFMSGKIDEQIKWSSEIKGLTRQLIVSNKIDCQRKLLEKYGLDGFEKLKKLAEVVLVNDKSNKEGQAARIYFGSLFGKQFNRRSLNNINGALNYGYSIILSNINRLLAIHGYNLALGLKHCNKKNSYNFSCDLMEPFRPFVDEYVFLNRERELDWDYKRELINLTYKTIYYGKRKMELHIAEDMFICDVIKTLNGNTSQIKEFDFI